jgi:glycosyltransferase involved in cell wall biosynthesis
VFVGEGPLQGEIQATNPDARITGWVDADRVRAEMSSARMLVYPSLLRETQGLTVLEAAALGVPAIVPDGCAARDSVVDGVTGLWFRSGDLISLQSKLRALAGDPALAQALGVAAYERFWRDPPTLERHARKLEAVYGAMLEEPAA